MDQEVVAANKTLLESFPDDIDAFNRLGRAYMELGEYALAKQAYESAIKLDPYNSIAEKNLNRLSVLRGSASTKEAKLQKVDPQTFIKEVGKAGVQWGYLKTPRSIEFEGPKVFNVFHHNPDALSERNGGEGKIGPAQAEADPPEQEGEHHRPGGAQDPP